MDLRKIQCKGVDWIELAQYRIQWLVLVNILTNLLFQ